MDRENLTKHRVKNTSSKLIDWIFDAAKPFEDTISFETIFLAISIMERYTENNFLNIDHDTTILAAVSLFIASKVIDIYSLQM